MSFSVCCFSKTDKLIDDLENGNILIHPMNGVQYFWVFRSSPLCNDIVANYKVRLHSNSNSMLHSRRNHVLKAYTMEASNEARYGF